MYIRMYYTIHQHAHTQGVHYVETCHDPLQELTKDVTKPQASQPSEAIDDMAKSLAAFLDDDDDDDGDSASPAPTLPSRSDEPQRPKAAVRATADSDDEEPQEELQAIEEKRARHSSYMRMSRSVDSHFACI